MNVLISTFTNAANQFHVLKLSYLSNGRFVSECVYLALVMTEYVKMFGVNQIMKFAQNVYNEKLPFFLRRDLFRLTFPVALTFCLTFAWNLNRHEMLHYAGGFSLIALIKYLIAPIKCCRFLMKYWWIYMQITKMKFLQNDYCQIWFEWESFGSAFLFVSEENRFGCHRNGCNAFQFAIKKNNNKIWILHFVRVLIRKVFFFFFKYYDCATIS